MKLGESLLGKKLPIAVADRTMRMALAALKSGDRRLASSRAVTAAVQAAVASVKAPPAVVEHAEKIVYMARKLIQELVIARAASLGLYGRTA